MIINFGSLNIDYVYSMKKIVKPGETLSSKNLNVFPGGKGLNQSVALARAGACVKHAGFVEMGDASFLMDILEESGVDISLMKSVTETNGHAIIQVEESGENCILLYGGTNRLIDEHYVKNVSQYVKPGDLILFQNETSAIAEMMYCAKEKGARIALNPSPMDEDCLALPLELVDIFILNEIEGERLTGEQKPDNIMNGMRKRFAGAKIVLTLGSEGSMFSDKEYGFTYSAEKCDEIVDTTAAGDTFTGYYLAGIEAGLDDKAAIARATKAAAICITRMGAAPSIPQKDEVEK
ncbi:MAG: ribokinase [Eubacterium sp.]